MKNIEKKDFFSAPEVAKLLKLSRMTIVNQIRAGKIKAQKVGKTYMIPRGEIEQYLGTSKKLTEKEKLEVKKVVDRAIKEYGEAIRMLGRE